MNTRKLSVTLFSILCISIMLNGYAYAAGEEIRVKSPDYMVKLVKNFLTEIVSFSYTIENLGDCDVHEIYQDVGGGVIHVPYPPQATPGQKITILDKLGPDKMKGLMCQCYNWDDDICDFTVTELNL